MLVGVPGLEVDSVDRFLAARDAWYATDATADGTRLPIELLSPGARYLSRAGSRVYTVEATGELPGGTRASRRAVVQLTGDARKPYTIVAWFDSISESGYQAETP